MTAEEHGRWLKLIIGFILWTMLCGLAGMMLPRCVGAPLPFRKPGITGPGEYVDQWKDVLKLHHCNAASYREEVYEWRFEDGYVVLTRPGGTMYLDPQKYKRVRGK